MAATSLPPLTIDWSAKDLDHTMKRFLHSCHLDFDGPLKDIEEAVKINYLLIWAGSEGQDIADTFTFAPNQTNRLEDYLSKFASYVKPRSNFCVACFHLLGCQQQPDEAADVYLKHLKELLLQCAYEDIINRTLLVDLFVFGLHLKGVQSALLKEGKDLTIDKALQITRTEETTRQHVEFIRSTRDENQVDHVQKRGQSHRSTEHSLSQTHESYNSNDNARKCGNCRHQHEKGTCPTKGTMCNKCRKYNHWAKLC